MQACYHSTSSDVICLDYFRQKQTISQMQQHINEIEERFNQNSFLLMSQRKEEEKYEMERKTSQCQISKIKAQLQNLSATKQEEIEKLQSKLGWVFSLNHLVSQKKALGMI